MIVPGSVNPLMCFSGLGGKPTHCSDIDPGEPTYKISRSLRFRSGARPGLHRNFTSSAVWTFSAWFKIGAVGVGGQLFGNAVSFGSNGALAGTSKKCVDVCAWYHVVVSNKGVFLNGVNAGAHTTASARNMVIGNSFDGYMADIHFVEDQALDATDFGAVNPITNEWEAKAYAGTYGTHGFWLKLDDPAQIGKDSSGANNHWTGQGFDLGAPGTQITYDSMKDSPTPYDDGTPNPPGNYTQLNPYDNHGAPPTDANLTFNNAGNSKNRSNVGMIHGKWYWEVTSNGGNFSAGITTDTASLDGYLGSDAESWAYYNNGQKANNNRYENCGPGVGNHDTIGVALDVDNKRLFFSFNGAWQERLNPATSTHGSFSNLPSKVFFPASGNINGAQCFYNFGQRPFRTAPPAGFKAVCTTNLPFCMPEVKPDGTAAHNVRISLSANVFKDLGYVPTDALLGSTPVVWGVHALKLANGIRAIQGGTYTITNSGKRFKQALGQGNP